MVIIQAFVEYSTPYHIIPYHDVPDNPFLLIEAYNTPSALSSFLARRLLHLEELVELRRVRILAPA